MSVGGVLTFTGAVSNERYLQIQADLASDTTRQNPPIVGEVDLTYQITSTLPSIKYYYLGSQRVAMRQGNEVYYLHGDHLGSTSLTTNITGTVVAQTRHHPFGEVRWESGSSVTDFGFTGQRNEVSFGLMDYKARFYSAGLGRFVSADTIVPDSTNSQNLNRYSYVLNNPLNLIDPTGHCSFDPEGNIDRFDCSLDEFEEMPIEDRLNWMNQFMKDVPRAEDWFNNIAGIIEGFARFNLSGPGSWLSIVDAAILEGIQDGFVLSQRKVTKEIINSGATDWKNFFDVLFKDQKDPSLVRLWGTAEASATAYGVDVAEKRGLSPNGYESFFLKSGDVYRSAAFSFEGGLGTPVSWVTTWVGVVAGSGQALEALSTQPMYEMGTLGREAGYTLGSFFNDPRSTWQGHSPVYWYSIMIWDFQAAYSNPE